MKIVTSVCNLVIVVLAIPWACQGETVTIAISHVNDISAQFESFKIGTHNSSKAPETCLKENQECIGGLVKVVHWLFDNSTVDVSNVPDDNMLRISASNLIGGESGWISAYSEEKGTDGWRDYGEQIVHNHMKLTTMVPGMKEFGAGLRQARIFTSASLPLPSKATLVNTCKGTYAANSTEKAFCDHIDPIQKFEVKTKGPDPYIIGIIGFVTPTVERLSLPGKLSFADVAESIKDATAKSTYNTFIAVGDGNLDMAKEILNLAPKVGLVIYGSGFSNTRNMSDEYPMKYKHGFIATAGKYGSSVGKMVLQIDTTFNKMQVVEAKLQVTTFPPNGANYNEHAHKMYNESYKDWEVTVQQQKNNNIGNTSVTLKGGENCWRQECNLGNLMTDAAVHCALSKMGKPFTSPLHAIWHGGAFFEDQINRTQSISKFDVHKWLPYHNNVRFVKVKGEHLWDVFHKSASGIDPEKAGEKDWRQFLQVSNGFEVHYDTRYKIPKVTRVRMAHDENGVPRLRDMELDKYYYLLIPTYLREGRGVYDFASTIWEDMEFGNVKGSVGYDDDCLEDYIMALKQVSIGLEERIWINEDGSEGKCGGHAVTIILTIIFTLLTLAVAFVGYFFVLPRLRRSSHVDYPPNQL